LRLRFEGDTRAHLEALAAGTYPVEGCGVLIGRAGNPVSVVQVTIGRNLVVERARDRYELDPGDILAAERSARAEGLDVVGFWHTHPDHPARPSNFDTERAWPDYVYVICSTTAEGVADLRAWWLDAASGQFDEAELA
jgi:proteasome lid subunit RPN8/RPN11